MTDLELRIFVRAQLLALLPLYDITDVLVIANNQPTTEGRNTDAEKAIYISSLGESPEGWQQRTYTETLEEAALTQSQTFATTLQIMAACQETDTPTFPQATDICRAASMALQSRQFVDALQAVNKANGVRRITAIRRPYIVNDQGQFELMPSFDVTITHTVENTTTAPVVTSTQADFYRV
jgi:hypothetical protein